MKTYGIVYKNEDKDSQKWAQFFEQKLQEQGWSFHPTPHLAIAIGGDGTMLEAFRTFWSRQTAFVGLHTGTLGFLADWGKEEAHELLQKILTEEPVNVEYSLVSAQVHTKEDIHSFLALNEMLVTTKNHSTCILDVVINGEFFESFRGDGLIVSTPVGSTGYNRSVDGAVLHPSFESMQVSELASINNKVYRSLDRPFILPKHHTLELLPPYPETVDLVVDGKVQPFDSIQKVVFRVADEKITFARYRALPFWHRVKEKFL